MRQIKFNLNAGIRLRSSHIPPVNSTTWRWLFPRMWGFWENGRQFIRCLCFFLSFFSWMEISSCTLIPLFMPGSVHSGSASWDDCDRVFPDELHMSSFPVTFPHYVPSRAACELVSCYLPTLCLDSSIVSPLQLHWVKGVCMFRCNLPPALLAEWSGSFTCHCSDMGVEQIPNGESAHKADSGKENSPTTPVGVQTRSLSITSPTLQQTSYPRSPHGGHIESLWDRNYWGVGLRVQHGTVCSQ